MPGPRLVCGRVGVPKGSTKELLVSPGPSISTRYSLSLKTSLILDKCVPSRTIPKDCTFRPVKLSHHCQVPSKFLSTQ